ncbi:MAG TPA: hypothetical protein P5519_03875 [Spirochaetia bacterium]|nr:hypothetical protein [Spirochaetales bacterium]HRS65009.1 hypothetical protein [Spirochaetia bacterium]HRV27508.1 hypothetical protein [Spirochaetia bacterium]
MKRYIFLLISLVMAIFITAQDETLDDIFNESSDIVITDNQNNQTNQNVQNVVQRNVGITITGSITTIGGITAGYTYLPWDERFVPQLDFNVGLTASSVLSLEAHPDTYFSYYASFGAKMDPLSSENVQWTNFSLSSIYCEYIWLDSVFWKVGKFAFTWGQGRIFNPGNLVSDSSSNYTVIASLPTLFSGGQIFIELSDSQFSSPMLPLYTTTIYGAKFDFIIWNTYLGLAGRWKPSENLQMLFSAKRTVFGFDIHADSTIKLSSETDPVITMLIGFYKQWGDFHVYGEYECTDFSNPQHDTGLAFGYNNIFGVPVDPVFKWLHRWSDGSGTITAGIKWDAWNHVKIESGISLVYGNDTSSYVMNNSNPSGQRLMAALLVTLSGGF